MISEADAARFLTQATFGTRLADMQQLQSLGYEGWLNKQFALQGGPHRDYVQRYYNPSGRASSRNLKLLDWRFRTTVRMQKVERQK